MVCEIATSLRLFFFFFFRWILPPLSEWVYGSLNLLSTVLTGTNRGLLPRVRMGPNSNSIQITKQAVWNIFNSIGSYGLGTYIQSDWVLRGRNGIWPTTRSLIHLQFANDQNRKSKKEEISHNSQVETALSSIALDGMSPSGPFVCIKMSNDSFIASGFNPNWSWKSLLAIEMLRI